MEKNNYKLLGISLLISFVAMYSISYTNLASIEHLTLSLTRLYRTILMTCAMAIIMLIVMKNMFLDKKLNMILYTTIIIVFLGALGLLRTQTFVGDDAYMQAMIPHHSSAILKSEEATLKDPQVKELARQIIIAQEEEIALMKRMLAGENVSEELQNRCE